MISRAEMEYLNKWAYIPEHLVAYVTAVQGAEPFIQDNYLFYVSEETLVVIGYPLGEDFCGTLFEEMLSRTMKSFPRATTAVITPGGPPSVREWRLKNSDHYYELSLSSLVIPAKTRNMIKRAARELAINRVAALGEDHQELVTRFLASRELDPGTGLIMRKIPEYAASSPGVKIWDARNASGRLAAFAIADFTPASQAMYMFNFTGEGGFVPGASDLLLAEIVTSAVNEGKRTFNLGLGINSGVSFFKTKWGARPAYPCNYYLRQKSPGMDLFSLFLR